MHYVEFKSFKCDLYVYTLIPSFALLFGEEVSLNIVRDLYCVFYNLCNVWWHSGICIPNWSENQYSLQHFNHAISIWYFCHLSSLVNISCTFHTSLAFLSLNHAIHSSCDGIIESIIHYYLPLFTLSTHFFHLFALYYSIYEIVVCFVHGYCGCGEQDL